MIRYWQRRGILSNTVKLVSSDPGKAPESDKALGLTGTRTGRPKNSANLSPFGKGTFDTSFGITWSFEYHEPLSDLRVKVTNTCPLDTCLMGLYFSRQYDHDMALAFRRERKHSKVLDLIHEARYEWIVYTEKNCQSRIVTIAQKSKSKEVKDGNGKVNYLPHLSENGQESLANEVTLST